MNIVILDGRTLTGQPADLDWREFEGLGSVCVYQHTESNEVEERLREADVALTNKVVIDKAVMESCPRLRYIGVLATGYNVVDIPEAHKLGIIVTNIPGYGTPSVAQHVMAMLLNVTNRVQHYADDTRSGAWCRSQDFCYWDTPITELSGSRFGIVGMGNIGCAVARIAQAIEMEVVATTRRNDLPDGVISLPLDDLLQTCDVVSLNCPLNESNRGFINDATLAKMKRGAILINTGRGPLVVESDVAQALKDGQLGAYCADVLCHEPASPDNPLLTAPNCYLTPHIAWASHASRARLMSIAAANLRAFIEGKEQNRV